MAKSFIGPFVVTFAIAVFVLMMQVLWLYLDDIAGKGLARADSLISAIRLAAKMTIGNTV